MGRCLVLAAFVCGVASCVPVTSSSVPPAATPIAGGAPRFESEQRWGQVGDTRWEPVTAADPSSSWVYQMTTDQRPDYLLVRASSDGGRTWRKER
ncbi:MAG: hypothetical protein JO190_05145, partial [Candidatus Eremiobacteraeota bacterium]|nr:hypothetical protein [Candidatus Eremiobacteraeota bacterium]